MLAQVTSTARPIRNSGPSAKKRPPIPVATSPPSAMSITRRRPSASPRTPPTRSIPAVRIDTRSSKTSIPGRSRTADWTDARPGERMRGASPAARSARLAATSVWTAPGSLSRSVRKVGRARRRILRMLARRLLVASSQPAALGAVRDIPSALGQTVAKRVGARVLALRPRGITFGEKSGDLRGHGLVIGVRRLPDPVEIETEDGIGVEDEPAPLVVGDRRPEDLAQEGERGGHVEIVVDRIHEPVVKGSPGVGEWGVGCRRTVANGGRSRRLRAVAGHACRDATRPIARRACPEGWGSGPCAVQRRGSEGPYACSQRLEGGGP